MIVESTPTLSSGLFTDCRSEVNNVGREGTLRATRGLMYSIAAPGQVSKITLVNINGVICHVNFTGYYFAYPPDWRFTANSPRVVRVIYDRLL